MISILAFSFIPQNFFQFLALLFVYLNYYGYSTSQTAIAAIEQPCKVIQLEPCRRRWCH